MAFPSIQLNFCLPSQRSTRFQTGKDKIPQNCRICAPAREVLQLEVSCISIRCCNSSVGLCKRLASVIRLDDRFHHINSTTLIFSSYSCSRLCRRFTAVGLCIKQEPI